MKFCTLASSSSGNCTLLQSGDTYILIDAGISMRRIVNSLKTLDVAPEQLCGIVLTHEHNDHICGLKMMTKYYDTPIYASPIVAENVMNIFQGADFRLRVFDIGQEFDLCGIGVKSYPTPHDTPESVCYRMEADGRSFAFGTDMGTVTQEVFDAFKGVNAAVIEANHDVEMLKNGPYPYHLKQRILSKNGHLSNNVSGKFCAALVGEGTEKIVLAHLSKQNNTPELAYHTVSERFSDVGIVVDKDASLTVAPADVMGRVYTV